jgi:hypothetical protein
MKMALIRTKTQKPKLSSSNQQQPAARRGQRNRNRRKKKKIEIGTHLTLIGVCTTVCPEKSGT